MASSGLIDTKGSIVIVVLWALAFFTMLTVVLAARIQSQVSFVRRFQEERNGEMTAFSGISYALTVLKRQFEEKEAASATAFSKSLKENLFRDASDRTFQIGHIEAGENKEPSEFVFGFQDEDSKININKIGEEVLVRFYMAAADLSEDQAGELAHSTIEWRARQKDFLEFGHVLGPSGAGFGTAEELLLVPGMTREVWAKLIPELTIFGAGQVNMNTVSAGTLKALGVNESLAGRIVQYRESQLQALNPDDRSAAEVFTDLGDLTQKVGVSAGEIDELENISSAWGFHSTAVRFLSVISGDARHRGVECVASRQGRILFFRNV